MELKGTKSQKLQWAIIFIAHIILLYWIIHALSHSGEMTTLEAVLHFAGIGSYGALLITISAWLGRRNYRLELESEEKSRE